MDGQNVVQEHNNKEVEMQALSEKYEMPLGAVKGFCGILDEVRNGLSNAEAMAKMQALTDEDFESEVNPA